MGNSIIGMRPPVASQLKCNPLCGANLVAGPTLRILVIDLILRLATGVRAAIAVAAFGTAGTYLFRLSPYERVKARLDGASLPEETITSPGRFAEVMAALDASGRELYLQFQAWDLLNPVLMGAAGAMVLGWLVGRSRRSRSRWRLVVLLPVVLLGADLLENGIIAMAVAAYPERAVIDNALPLVTAVKFAAAIATMVSVVSLALVWARNSRSDTRRRAT